MEQLLSFENHVFPTSEDSEEEQQQQQRADDQKGDSSEIPEVADAGHEASNSSLEDDTLDPLLPHFTPWLLLPSSHINSIILKRKTILSIPQSHKEFYQTEYITYI